MAIETDAKGSHASQGQGALTDFSPQRVIEDYRIGYQSRQASLLGRREVLTGKAKFGIFGDGKEVAQLAMAQAFRKGDFRSGYYRDQTFALATGMTTLDELFAQLYAHPDLEADPASAGRQMNGHFATRSLHPDGSWKDLTQQVNTSADLSPTGSQMPRLLGLAYASRLYRELPELADFATFSKKGEEIAFGTIGNASCAEGMFWETINAAGVLRAPLLLSIWDDGYGISVPNELQVTKGDLSALLEGFRRQPESQAGFDLYRVKGWDYAALSATYLAAAEIVRREHVPAVIHVVEMTQPQGHSTSGSHERYKSPERLQWESDFCCLKKMREWMLERRLATAVELDAIEAEETARVRESQRRAWDALRREVDEERRQAVALTRSLAAESAQGERLEELARDLERKPTALRREIVATVEEALFVSVGEGSPARRELVAWSEEQERINEDRYSSHLWSQSQESALRVPAVPPVWSDDAPVLNGYEILTRCFDAALGRMPNLIAFGEDLGRLGDVNQGFQGLQERYGELRVSDTGIRECTILGQAIGMALRGLRPLAEIQYLDYLLYALQILSDDLATLHWRTRGGQKAPVIVRTRGHRLEGIWHSGSPMAGILNLVRGVQVCVPRDMTRAAGMYNTLLRADEPALVVEVLNGYRIKERLPANIGEMTVPLGEPEILRRGDDVTVVTYGACCRIALEAAQLLADAGIEAEVVDVQTLLPFDRPGTIVRSLERTGRLVLVDEDVPGGATAFMLQQVLEGGGYRWLDSEPRTVSGKAHRPAYGSDGDYFSKPNRERVFRAVYELMGESEPRLYPPLGG